MNRYFIYARKSTDEENRQVMSIAAAPKRRNPVPSLQIDLLITDFLKKNDEIYLLKTRIVF